MYHKKSRGRFIPGGMMRLSVYARGVAFLCLLFTVNVYAVHYESVPKACEQVLRGLDKRYKVIEPLNETIDWSPIKESMHAIGYPQHIISRKLKDMEWDPDMARTTLRIYSGNKYWQWGEELEPKAFRNLGAGRVQTQDYELASKSHYYADHVVASLPYWYSIKGFDAAEFVYAYLLQREKDGSNVGEDEVKYLLQYAPLWISGPHALLNAKRFYTHLEDKMNATLIAKYLSRRQQAQFFKFVRAQVSKDHATEIDESSYEDYAMRDIRFTSVLPWRKLPASVRSTMADEWGVDLKTYPPIRMDSIHMIGNNSYQDAGNCEMMTNGHMNSLGLHLDPNCKNEIGQEEWKESVLIRVNGTLVGSLKLVGDPSMLALRNVMDSSGRLVLAMGGVYHIEKDLYYEIANKRRNANGRWRSVNVDSLGVHPHSYMLNDNAWTDTNKYQMIKVLGDDISREELVSIIREMIRGDDDFLTDGEVDQRVKHHTLKAIDRIRQKLD